ncbi:MAG: lipase secretion chaperone [Pseudomonadota bacterium]|nr:lipase secretion chaperone [Pseudomonadota bacterium]
MSITRSLVAFIGIVIVILTLLIMLKPSESQQTKTNPAVTAVPTPSIAATSAGITVDPVEDAPQARFQTGLEQLPASLHGTEVDGEIIIDQQRQLVVTRRLRDLFDYFLSTIGEESLHTIQARVIAYIQHRVPEPAQSQAIQVFQQYLAYREAIRQIPETGGKSADQIDINAITKQKSEEQRLRQQYFNTETIQAFFGDEDAYDQYALQSLQIARNSQLSEAEKAKQTAALLQQLPESLRESIQIHAQYQNLQDLTEQWKSRKGSAEELRQIRLNLVGEAATQRLEQLDQSRATWQTRVDHYLQEHAKIMRNPQWSVEQKQVMVLSLRRQQGFTEQEQLRLPAFEQMAAQTAVQPR